MKLKAVSGMMLTLLLISMLTLAFNIQPVKAEGTIYIRPHGTVDPLTAPIQRDEDIYTFTGNIYAEIVVERDNIVVDGAGYTLKGAGSGTGIDLSNRSNVTIKNMEIKAFRIGIRLYESSINSIYGNGITNNDWYGIILHESSNNSVYGNKIANNGSGIRLWIKSSNNSVYGNNITANNHDGILLYESSNNSVYGNNIANNDYGIRLSWSSNNTLRNNNATNNRYNFGVDSRSLSDYIQDIDASNTVDGRPIYYLVNRQDMAVPLNAGYVALVNCTCMTVKNLNLTDNGQGVLLASTTNSTITKNNITANSHYGIIFHESSNNSIYGNNIANNWCGIELGYWSSNNNIAGNNITANRYKGIGLHSYSNNNSIAGNNITNNNLGFTYGITLSSSSNNNSIYGNNIETYYRGISLFESSNNTVYHNNFVDNTKQVYSHDSTNVWDDGYPSGGNYWSDYTGVDLYSGPNQDQLGSDGIGDLPYVIDENNVDRYPLMKPMIRPISRTIRIKDAETGLDSITLGSPTEPMPPEGYPFTVNVTLNGTTNYLHSFQVAVAFDKTKVKCTAAWIPKRDPNFVFYGESPLMGFVGIYNDKGLVVLGSSLSSDYVTPDHTIPRHVNVTGEKLLCQINFTTIETGASTLELITTQEPIYPTWNTVLMDTNENPINFTKKGFSVTTIALQPPPLVTAYTHIQPDVLSLRSRGKWVTAYVELPEGYDIGEIDVSTILIDDSVPAEWGKAEGNVLMVKFDRQAVIEYIRDVLGITNGEVTLTTIGKLSDGTSFEGSDSIRVVFSSPPQQSN